jgi:hypothetical protein
MSPPHQKPESLVNFRKIAEKANDPVVRFVWSCVKWVVVAFVGVLAYAAKPYFYGLVADAPAVAELRNGYELEHKRVVDAAKKADEAAARIDVQAEQNERTLKILVDTSAALQELKIGQAAVLQRVSDIQDQQKIDRQSIENRLNAVAAQRARSP